MVSHAERLVKKSLVQLPALTPIRAPEEDDGQKRRPHPTISVPYVRGVSKMLDRVCTLLCCVDSFQITEDNEGHAC